MMAFDASWLDKASIGAAVASYAINKFAKSLHWFHPQLYLDMLNGLAVPPIAVLMASAVASSLLEAIKGGSRITLFLSGAAALFALFDPSRTGKTVKTRPRKQSL
jgi:hypothetical protein